MGRLGELAIAALALVVSVVAFAVSRKAQGTQEKFQARLLEIEQARDRFREIETRQALLRAKITKQDGKSVRQYRLETSNEGESGAREIYTSPIWYTP